MNKLLLVSISSAAAVQFNTSSNSTYFAVNWDTSNLALQFNVTLPTSQTLNLYFGNGTTPSDLVSFFASGTGTVSDRYGTVTSSTADTLNNWTNVLVSRNGTTSYQFLANRKPTTTDSSGKDTAIPCNQTSTYLWQIMPANTNGTWSLNLDANCNPFVPVPIIKNETLPVPEEEPAA